MNHDILKIKALLIHREKKTLNNKQSKKLTQEVGNVHKIPINLVDKVYSVLDFP